MPTREEKDAMLPGDMPWSAEDPECPLECWSEPVVHCWGDAGEVYEVMTAVQLPNIFVTNRVLTVDEHGDPDETEPAWFRTRAEAEKCWPESLAAARGKTGEQT